MKQTKYQQIHDECSGGGCDKCNHRGWVLVEDEKLLSTQVEVFVAVVQQYDPEARSTWDILQYSADERVLDAVAAIRNGESFQKAMLEAGLIGGVHDNDMSEMWKNN